MVQAAGYLSDSEYGSLGGFSDSNRPSSGMRTKQMKRALLLLGVTALCIVALLAMVTNVHHADRPHEDVELVSEKVAAVKAKAHTKIATKAKAAAAPKKVEMTAEEKIESLLRKNLDRTANSIGKSQLEPLLLRQGRQVLHSPVKQVQKTMKKETIKDLHHALIKDHHLDTAAHTVDRKTVVQSKKERTEDALRKQLNEETERKEKEMLAKSLKMAQDHATKKQHLAKSGRSVSEQEEEAQLKAQLEKKVEAKQKEMYKQAFNNWMEKQQKVKLQKAKTKVTLAHKETQLFKDTLKKVEHEGPETKHVLRNDLHNDHYSEHKTVTDHKPSFKQWLKAFKHQLNQRTVEASKKIAEARYSTVKKGKKGTPSVVAHPKAHIKNAISDAGQRKAQAQEAIKLLKKSLKDEKTEEKAVHKAEEDEQTPGKALAALQKTMKQERAALKIISSAETGDGADPNIAALSPKTSGKSSKGDGLLGLDDLDYI